MPDLINFFRHRFVTTMKNLASSLWGVMSLIPLLGGVDAKSIWSSSPGTYGVGDNYILKSGYPVGNGILAGMLARSFYKLIASKSLKTN